MDDNHHGIVGGVDTHKDIHFAAVVDTYDRVLASNSFPTTRQGYKSMLNWMQSFGEVKRAHWYRVHWDLWCGFAKVSAAV
ncbi:hypothetical protein SAMN06297164_2618 [Nitrosomonas ureae]|uniref:Transposase n=1 Tax=Nitrosomonas ureae TaxID=44577 RepID=A0A286AF98_9PROT|nr:hypothetical protein SAMN06297164_2618 [Nitrosomonas ureae]